MLSDLALLYLMTLESAFEFFSISLELKPGVGVKTRPTAFLRHSRTSSPDSFEKAVKILQQGHSPPVCRHLFSGASQLSN